MSCSSLARTTHHRGPMMSRMRKTVKGKASRNMPLVLEQQFPLGRFHATRWNQNPFEDRYGEWPPSPWRLLRALAARLIQYSRESGDEDIETRNELLHVMASQVPSFCLPGLTWR